MKKLILWAVLMGSTAIASNAQANSVLVYGQIGYSSSKSTDDFKNRAFNISPGVGYQFDNHWTLGISGSFNTNRSKPNTANADWNYSNSYGAGAFVRYTAPVSKIFAFYNQFDAGYLGTTTNLNTGGSTIKSNGFKASLTPAIGINIINGFALNLWGSAVSVTRQQSIQEYLEMLLRLMSLLVASLILVFLKISSVVKANTDIMLRK